MNEIPIPTFEKAIQATHGATSQLVDRVRVDERFEGQPVWEGEVLVFQLLDHPEASRCYCWEKDGSVTCVLGVGPVDSAEKAVRASILSQPCPRCGAVHDDDGTVAHCGSEKRYGEK
jgi:hypothetical protein